MKDLQFMNEIHSGILTDFWDFGFCKAIKSDGDKKIRIQTDVIMLQKASGDYIHLMEGIEKKGDANESASLEELLTSTIITEYGNKKEALNLVAITDGASSIRLYFERVFGFVIMLILDWYHLEKKIWDLMA